MQDLYKEFVSTIEEIYGDFNERRKSFKKASNSKIARELCYSDSQFSRLINESASEGEYQRAIKNAKRLLSETMLKEQIGELKGAGLFTTGSVKRNTVWISAVLIIIVIFSVAFFYQNELESRPGVSLNDRDSMLEWIFETSNISPFVKLDELPADCDYPCYKYQGKWNLKNPYKIPLYRERNGFHYLAKDVNLYTSCMAEETPDGDMFEGYEYQSHEIWYDKRELQIDSFLVDTDPTLITDIYNEMDFEDNSNFVKLANIHTFFRNEFTLTENSIERSGKVIGRDVEYIADDILLEELETESMVDEMKGEINTIIVNRLEDFSRPISCSASDLADPDFHSISELDEMSFVCQLTTANAPIEYTKTYVFNDQFIETACRPRN